MCAAEYGMRQINVSAVYVHKAMIERLFADKTETEKNQLNFHDGKTFVFN